MGRPAKNTDKEYINVAFKLPKDVHKKFKALSWESGIDLQKFFPMVAEQFLRDNEVLMQKAARRIRNTLEKPLSEKNAEELQRHEVN